jgi:hypothetical protein
MAFTKVVGAGIHTLSNITSHNIHSSGIVTATRFDGPFTNLNVTGVTTFAGDVSIGGTLTYEDVTNIDSVGLITARDGIFISDSKKLELGNAAGSGDLRIYHDANNSFIQDAGTGQLRFLSNDYVFYNAAGNENLLRVTENTGIDLYDGANTIRLSTNDTGVEVTGILTASNGLDAIGIQSGGVNITTGIITAINFVGAGNTFKVDGTTVDISISGNTGAGGTWSSYTAGIATTKSVGINTNNFDDPDVVGAGNSFQGLYISNGMIIHDNSLNGNHYIGTAMNGLMAGPVTINGVLTVEGNYVVV